MSVCPSICAEPVQSDWGRGTDVGASTRVLPIHETRRCQAVGTEKPVLANKRREAVVWMVWFAFYDFQPVNRADPILTT